MGRKESEDLRLACLLTSLTYLLQQAWLASAQGKSAGVGGWDSVEGEGILEGTICRIHWRWGWRRGGYCRLSAIELEMRLGVGFGGEEGEMKICN